ncbi:MAG TPA: hypothetical protein VF735_21430 [Pyrinomonadaceae bacterium]
MRRISLWLLVATCTFALGFAAAMLWSQLPHPAVAERNPSSNPPCISSVALDPNVDISAASNLPILDYCELATNPERYSGKIVRVRARLSGFIHGMVFSDENCLGVNNQAAASYYPPMAEEIRQTLNRARGSDSSMNWLEPVNIIAIAKFKKVTPSNESDTIYDTASLQLEIMRVEKASKLH